MISRWGSQALADGLERQGATVSRTARPGFDPTAAYRLYLRLLDTKLMFGVGAAYDFHTGRIQDAPQWVKTIGMQWMHRLLQDPRRLWKRYLRNNPAFMWHIALQLSGLRQYPATRVEYLPTQPDVGRSLKTDTGAAQLTTPAASLQRLSG